MNYIDYIIIILLLISAVKGATKGFVYEIASLLALIAGVWGAIKFSGATETFLVQRLDFTSKHIEIIAFAITFVLIIVLVHFIGKAVEKAVESVSLSGLNRLLGLLFSVVKTAFILGILVILIERLDESLPFLPEDDVQESSLYNPLKNVAVSTFPFVQGLIENIRDKAQPEEDTQESSES